MEFEHQPTSDDEDQYACVKRLMQQQTNFTVTGELDMPLEGNEMPLGMERTEYAEEKRQLKILEAGLLVEPAIPLDKSNKFAMKLSDIIQASEMKAIDTGKNSETMKTLCNAVMSLIWRSPDGSPTNVCHWADGYPLNVHVYISLLYSIFDIKDETSVVDEVDGLLELMKKKWSMLGLNRSIHNLCFTWVLFEQYFMTGPVELDLLSASLAMSTEVANDVKKVDRELIYVKMLASVLTEMKRWLEKRLLDCQ
ncbi:Protein of unknown function (DUF810) [Abeliophyllum distichum]|uniref:Uncharacterized protein n=1 Tax=Abeliophyllum distichum TaxID=126358 RepID=A0ABD1TY56_9LAMI